MAQIFKIIVNVRKGCVRPEKFIYLKICLLILLFGKPNYYLKIGLSSQIIIPYDINIQPHKRWDIM